MPTGPSTASNAVPPRPSRKVNLDPNEQHEVHTPTPAGPARVLVVEDESELRSTLRRIFEKDGYDLMTAGSAEDGLALLESNHFDAVVTDIHLPGMDGTELLRRARERYSELPVILFTGEPDVHTAIAAVEHRAFHYLTKPFRAKELMAVVGRAVAHRRIAEFRAEAAIIASTTVDDGDTLPAQFGRALDTIWFAYQPIIDRDWVIRGYEALLRSEESSLRGPVDFLGAAERLGRADELARLIRKLAPTAVLDHPEQPLLFMNVDPSQLRDDRLVTENELFSQMADRVILEITERASLTSIPGFEHKVMSLKKKGFKIAVDDLGAGYSGLTTFAQLEPEFVKLDGSLVRGVGTSERKRMIIGSMASLCLELGIAVVAEGVETQEEFEVLRELGCTHFQGFFVGRPAPL